MAWPTLRMKERLRWWSSWTNPCHWRDVTRQETFEIIHFVLVETIEVTGIEDAAIVVSPLTHEILKLPVIRRFLKVKVLIKIQTLFVCREVVVAVILQYAID